MGRQDIRIMLSADQLVALLSAAADGLSALSETLRTPEELRHYSSDDIDAMQKRYDEGREALNVLQSANRWRKDY